MPGAAAELGLVTQVMSDKDGPGESDRTAGKLAAKPPRALQASKRLMRQPFREQIKAAMKAENEEFSAQVRSEDAKEAFNGFLWKAQPDFARTVNLQPPHRHEKKTIPVIVPRSKHTRQTKRKPRQMEPPDGRATTIPVHGGEEIGPSLIQQTSPQLGITLDEISESFARSKIAFRFC